MVRLAAVADRGAAPAGDPRGHAEKARVRAARHRRRDGQERHLRRQLRAAVQRPAQGGPERDHDRQARGDPGRVRRDGRHAQQHPLRLRPPRDRVRPREGASPAPSQPLPGDAADAAGGEGRPGAARAKGDG